MIELSKILLVILLFSQNFAVLCFGTNSDSPKQHIKNQLPDDATLGFEMRRKTFDVVWETFRDKYYDPTFDGLNWNDVRMKYLPEVEKLPVRPFD